MIDWVHVGRILSVTRLNVLGWKRLDLPSAGGLRTVHKREPEPHFFYDASKRLLDVSLSVALIVISLPVLAFAASGIVLTTRRNPILLQIRTGRLGHEFRMLKLRTMQAAGDPESQGSAVSGEIFVSKTPDDLRVSWFGRLLRRSSIDELPQLLNVLGGQMSLVGPRPSLPLEVARYPNPWRRRLAVKPGLTGLWQVSGRSEVEPARRIAMDRHYIRHRSLAADCLILLRTVFATISMRGAW